MALLQIKKGNKHTVKINNQKIDGWKERKCFGNNHHQQQFASYMFHCSICEWKL